MATVRKIYLATLLPCTVPPPPPSISFTTAMTAGQPAWLRALVNEHDVDPKALVATTGLEISLSPRPKSTTSRRPKRVIHPSQLPPFDNDLQCEQCGKAFRRVCNYREHQRVHSNEYKFQCSVQGCARKFMWRSSIQAHLRSHQAKLDRQHRSRRALKARSPIVKTTQLAPVSPYSPVVLLTPQHMAPRPVYEMNYVAAQHPR